MQQWLFEQIAGLAAWLMFQRGRWAILRAVLLSLSCVS